MRIVDEARPSLPDIWISSADGYNARSLTVDTIRNGQDRHEVRAGDAGPVADMLGGAPLR